MLIIVAIMIISIYMACPLIGKIALLIVNSIVPDPIPFVDEFIMWIGLLLHLSLLMRSAEFVYTHKKLMMIFGCLFVGCIVLVIVLCNR